MKTKFLILALLAISLTSIGQTDSSFTETPVTLETKTGKIFGMLCTPRKFSKIPIALIIAGSGPTD
ncbi:MAG TPA: hypothetical protein VNZ45_06150 [Bacteroidia bacterium]|nr:hypothetical protein [Bacteroidia bacterium]